MPSLREGSASPAPQAGTSRPGEPSLASFQEAFLVALAGTDGTKGDCGLPPFARQPGFAVYRNTVARACIDALAANFPTVLQVVGAAWFADAAQVFTREHRPQAGCLASYGDGFDSFLAAFAPARELPYLSGIARLDRLWNEAHRAADAVPMTASDLAGLAPEQFAATTLIPHPAARWASFSELPVLTLWRRHRESGDLGADLAWQGENALLTRPGGRVEWRAIDAAALTFLEACAQGASFAEATAGAGEAAVVALPALLGAGAFAKADR